MDQQAVTRLLIATRTVVPLAGLRKAIRRTTVTDEAAHKVYEVNVEGTVHPWPSHEITVSEIRTLGGLPGNEPVLEVNLETNVEKTLHNDAVVKLRAGVGFSRKIEFKRGIR
jgi:hypothetical protein